MFGRFVKHEVKSMLDFVIVGVTGNRKWFKDVPFLWFLFVPYFHWHDVSMNTSSLKYHYKTRITSPRHHMNDILFFSIVDLHLIEVMKSQPRFLGLEDLSNVNSLMEVMKSQSRFLPLEDLSNVNSLIESMQSQSRY